MTLEQANDLSRVKEVLILKWYRKARSEIAPPDSIRDGREMKPNMNSNRIRDFFQNPLRAERKAGTLPLFL
jgi:hypothetical protein